MTRRKPQHTCNIPLEKCCPCAFNLSNGWVQIKSAHAKIASFWWQVMTEYTNAYNVRKVSLRLSFQNSHSRKNWIVSQPDELNKKRVLGDLQSYINHQSSIINLRVLGEYLRHTSTHKLATLISSWITTSYSSFQLESRTSAKWNGSRTGRKFHPISFTELPKMEVRAISKTHGISNWYNITQNATESVSGWVVCCHLGRHTPMVDFRWRRFMQGNLLSKNKAVWKLRTNLLVTLSNLVTLRHAPFPTAVKDLPVDGLGF